MKFEEFINFGTRRNVPVFSHNFFGDILDLNGVLKVLNFLKITFIDTIKKFRKHCRQIWKLRRLSNARSKMGI